MIEMPIELYTDGSCIKSPGAGPGGCAYIIKYYEQNDDSDMPTEKEIEFKQGYRYTTSNRMEIIACIEGLNKIVSLVNDLTLQGATQVNVFSDSEYLCNSINKRWIEKWQENNWMTSGFKNNAPSPVKNKDLWERLLEVKNQLRNISLNMSITHINGHSGHQYNERCDQLAKSATREITNQLIDQEYEKIAPILNKR